MKEDMMIAVDNARKVLQLPESLMSASFFDICDPAGRILHKIDSLDSSEIDVSFLSEGKYILWTVCEGNALQFHFMIK